MNCLGFKLLLLSFISFSCLLSQQTRWISFADSLNQFSSPRLIDLNGDNIKDVVIGGGVEDYSRQDAITAWDGSNGQKLWSVGARDEVFGSAVFQDINGDSVPDVFIGGRDAILKAIDGSNGQLIWEFWSTTNIPPKDSGYLQFYSSQWIPDQNSDGYQDLLVANGGDPDALPWDTNRLPGHLMIINALTGQILAKAVVPDSQETYCSPVVSDLTNDGDLEIIFGTGGETINGHLYVAKLQDLLNNDLSNAQSIMDGMGKGFIAPVSLADMNGNSTLDIVAISFDGYLKVFDGSSYWEIHSHSFDDFETSAAPVIGSFTGNFLPDIVLSLYEGNNQSYSDYKQIMLDGYTGQVVKIDSFGAMQFSSGSAADLNHDGFDELIVSLVNSNGGIMSHSILAQDYIADSAYVLYTSSGQNLGSSPLVQDIDGNDSLELIFAVGLDSLNPKGAQGFNLHCVELNSKVTSLGVAWGAYMGTSYDGHYHFEGNICDTISIASLGVSMISCNGFDDGKMYFTPTGGQQPYMYQFSNNVTDSLVYDLSPGMYWARVIDANGCYEDHFQNFQDPHIVSKYTQDVGCQGGSNGVVDITTTGCTCQFSNCTFQWSNGDSTHTSSNVSAGTYVVTITSSSGCVIIDSATVNDGPPLIDSSMIIPPTCKGDSNASIVLYPHYTFNMNFDWSDGQIGNYAHSLAPDTYYVTVSNSGCYDTLEFVVEDPDSFHAVASGSDLICADDSSGAINLYIYYTPGPYNVSYMSWDSAGNVDSLYDTYYQGGFAYFLNDSNKTGGLYGIILTNDNGCKTDTLWVDLFSPDTLFISTGSENVTSFGAGDGKAYVSAYGGIPPYDYLWNDFNQQNSDTAYSLDTGMYEVVVSDSNGCIKTDSVYVGTITSVAELDNVFKVYPNPSDGELDILGPTSLNQGLLEVFDDKGSLVYQIMPYNSDIDLTFLSSGFYTLRLSVSGISRSIKWVKR